MFQIFFYKIFVLILFFFYFHIETKLLKHIPKVSVYMPIYNKSKYLKESIKNLQSQTLKDIEIIAVNDCSTDNSLDILNELKKNDSRIKIVNNDKNRGLLYARAMGITHAKGEYLINVDPDDSLKGNDALEYLYNIANQYKVDVVNFGVFKWGRYDINSNYNNIVRQPKIFENAFTNQNNINDYLIWNKLVKRNIMIKTYEAYKKEINSEK